MPFAVVVKIENSSVRQWDPSNSLAKAIIAVHVLVDVIAEVEDIVDRVLAHRVSVGVEEAKREIAARVHSKTNVGNCIIRCWSGLCTAKDRGLV